MSNELIPKEIGGELAAFDFDSLTKGGGDFLPQLRLHTSSSDACKESKIPNNHYGLVKGSDLTDVGEEVNVVILSVRPTALRKTEGMPLISHNQSSTIFQDIRAKSDAKSLADLYGPEWLLWFPEQETFATFFMCSATARNEAKKLKPLLRKAATLKWRLASNAKYKWAAPLVLACSLPLAVPDVKLIQEELDKFLNVPEPEVELAPEDTREV